MAQNPQKAPKSAKVKRTLKERAGKASGWLPAVAAFLCLCFFAMIAVALFDVNSEPESQQSANVTAVSAQGFAGLRRLLEARGSTITLNRMEDGPLLEHADLEIITLDNDGGTSTYGYQTADDYGASSDDDDAAYQSEAEDSESSASARMEAVSVPDPRRAKHILYNPLGKAVLIVAPKWQAGPDPKHPRWAMGEAPIEEESVRWALGVLSPVTEVALPEKGDDDDASASSASASHVQASADPYTQTLESDTTAITFDIPEYEIGRVSHLVYDEPERTGDTQKDLVNRALSKLKGTPVPIRSEVTLTPAPGENLFRAPLTFGPVEGLQSISGPNLQPVLLGPNGEVILSRVIVTRGRKQPAVPVYLLSDPDLLNNQILASPQKVASALTLTDAISPGGKKPGSVVFNLTFNGISFEHDLLHALSRPPFIGVPLCLLIAGLGLMWAAFTRFGPVREAAPGPALGRGVRILADNAARLMAITLKEVKLGPAYADLVRDQVIRHKGYIAGSHRESPDDLAERIGTSSKAADSFIDLKARAGRAVTVHQLIDITLKLHAWKTEIQRAHT